MTQSRSYDDLIARHYHEQTVKHGLRPTYSMADRVIRRKETEAVCSFIRVYLQRVAALGLSRPLTICDVGCGNGYTLQQIARQFPGNRLIGFELTEGLCELARSRFRGNSGVSISRADIRMAGFPSPETADVIVCQRVLINLLEPSDQRIALANILEMTRAPSRSEPGSWLIFIESFLGPLAKLNKARRQLGLPPTQPQYHNLYLPDNFFTNPRLRVLRLGGALPAPNFLSTHYFVGRVLYPIFAGNPKGVSRNSELVDFFVAGLRPNIGNYSPLRITYTRRA